MAGQSMRSYTSQTKDGYIWLATFDGLVRFDGDQIIVFNSGNTDAFSTNRNVTSLQITLPYLFYETYWFYTLIIFLIGFTIYVV